MSTLNKRSTTVTVLLHGAANLLWGTPVVVGVGVDLFPVAQLVGLRNEVSE